MTIEEKEKAGLSRKAPAKEILKIDADGNVVERYISLKNAGKANGVTASAISNAIYRHTLKNGCTFEYAKTEKQKIEMPEKKRYFDHIRHVPYGF